MRKPAGTSTRDNHYLITVDEFERWCARMNLPFRMTMVDAIRDFAERRGEPLPPLPNRPGRKIQNAQR